MTRSGDAGSLYLGRMNVGDVMSVGVITVACDTPVKEVARIMHEARVGGLPVIVDGVIVGIVTSSDILGSVPNVGGMRTAGDVMTRDPVCLREDLTVAGAARVLARNRIKRAPVLRDGKLVGMVTRSDLLRPYLRTDGEIRADVEDSVLIRTMHLRPHDVQVEVDAGVVTLRGAIEHPEEVRVLERLVRAIDGVVDVAIEIMRSAQPAHV
jgi:CBS domain-containing protein